MRRVTHPLRGMSTHCLPAYAGCSWETTTAFPVRKQEEIGMYIGGGLLALIIIIIILILIFR